MSGRNKQGNPRGNRIDCESRFWYSHFVVIDDMPEGNWGCAGGTICMECISASVGLATTSRAVALDHSTFPAKARLLAPNNYPEHMASMLRQHAMPAGIVPE